jgi:hypothetical protein
MGAGKIDLPREPHYGTVKYPLPRSKETPAKESPGVPVEGYKRSKR